VFDFIEDHLIAISVSALLAIGLAVGLLVAFDPSALSCSKGESLKVAYYQTMIVGTTVTVQPIYECEAN
jgi:hypothetical protein